MKAEDWIDRKVHAPDIGKTVLVWVVDRQPNGYMDFGHRVKTDEFGQVFKIRSRDTATYNVTHWMPLPQTGPLL